MITCKKCQSTYSEYDWKKNAFQVFDILDEITSEVIGQEHYCKFCLNGDN